MNHHVDGGVKRKLVHHYDQSLNYAKWNKNYAKLRENYAKLSENFINCKHGKLGRLLKCGGSYSLLQRRSLCSWELVLAVDGCSLAERG
ncbi:hypothetical protein CDAR_397041 [Caerostris darwini]|uniref:Uncharacterized protein n=1 Tax=Caerostris darwini TaxID=1538125 RepID=A0AAV4Q6L4_9ARAC|nr:hypothetical protein CDAR_397041 [Caerostris darwini]